MQDWPKSQCLCVVVPSKSYFECAFLLKHEHAVSKNIEIQIFLLSAWQNIWTVEQLSEKQKHVVQR